MMKEVALSSIAVMNRLEIKDDLRESEFLISEPAQALLLNLH